MLSFRLSGEREHKKDFSNAKKAPSQFEGLDLLENTMEGKLRRGTADSLRPKKREEDGLTPVDSLRWKKDRERKDEKKFGQKLVFE